MRVSLARTMLPMPMRHSSGSDTSNKSGSSGSSSGSSSSGSSSSGSSGGSSSSSSSSGSSSGSSSSSSSSSNNSNSNSSNNMLLYGFLGVLCFVRTIESAPLTPESNGDPESSRLESTETLLSGLQSKKGQEEEVGNPSEIAYQAWLLIDGHPDSHPLGGLDSASLLRRIKPKSIFVAPNLTACPDGYQDDTMNRCVKDVNIDHQAHKGFLVQRLQAIFGSKSHASASSSSLPSGGSVATGPLQLNIPLLISAPSKSPPSMEIKRASTTDTSNIVTEGSPSDVQSNDKDNDHQENNHRDAIVTVYELNEDESTFFLGNKTSGPTQQDNKKASKRPELLAAPVAEFVDETNANSSGVVDYEIPNEKTHNLTLLVGGTIGQVNEGTYEETPSRVHAGGADETNISPTLVLLLSPTKVPSIPVPSSELIVAHNSSLGQVIIKMENVTNEDDALKEIIRVSVPDPIGASSSSSATTGIIPSDNADDSTTTTMTTTMTTLRQEEDEEQVEGSSESTEPYYEENYEESTEGEDEILKHSEAGMTVTLAAPREKATGQHESDKEQPTRSSEISSEVSINGDFVRETTLIDFNVGGRAPSSTDSPNVKDSEGPDEVTEVTEDRAESVDDLRNDETLGVDVDDSKVSEEPLRKMPIVVLPVRPVETELAEPIEGLARTTERMDSAETMIASSTNDAGTVVSRHHPKFDIASLSSSKKRAGQPYGFGAAATVAAAAAAATTKIQSKPFTTVSNVEGVYDYEPRDYPQRNPYGVSEEDVPVIRTMDEQQRYRPDNEEEDQNFFPLRQQQRQQHHDYVRFPSYDRHGRPNFVRFPSEEANSINPNDYKERRPYNRYQQQQQQPKSYGRNEPTTKDPGEQDVRQKQSYWWLPPGWRTDKEQQEVEQRSRSGADRSRTPMLLRFWTRMPLVRDPSLNYQHPTYPSVGQRDSGLPRRVNYYKEMSTHDFNRAFARKSPPSAIGG